MKINLPCEIVMDLLPSYIDGLTSEMSTESVDEHLKECEKCQIVLEDMKKDFSKEKLAEMQNGFEKEGDVKEETEDVEKQSEGYLAKEDKYLIKKINRKINKRVKLSMLIGLFCVALFTLAVYILYNSPLKKIDIEEVEVTAKVYQIDELRREYGTAQVTETKDGVTRNYEETNVTFHIPDSPIPNLTMSAEQCAATDYITIISWKLPYNLRVISYDNDKPEQENIKYIDELRTTFFNNQPISDNMTSMVELNKLDKIIYVHEDGTETVLWENEEE